MKFWRSVIWVGAACLMSHFGQEAWAQDCGAWVNRAPASGEVTCVGADSQTPGTLYAGARTEASSRAPTGERPGRQRSSLTRTCARW